MDLKNTISKWHEATCLLENDQLQAAVGALLSIKSPSAKIFHNIGCLYMMQCKYPEAIEFFTEALERDNYLVLSYFQRGICHHSIQRFDKSEIDFMKAESMTPPDGINYRPLGADYILHHNKIAELLKINRQGYNQKNGNITNTFSSRQCFFWPSKKMVENLRKQDFLGKAKIISSTAEKDIVYAAEKTSASPHVQSKGRHSSSLPSTPTPQHKGRIILTHNGDKVVVPPRPSRPPPSLTPGGQPQGLGHSRSQCESRVLSRSKSSENILDSCSRSDIWQNRYGQMSHDILKKCDTLSNGCDTQDWNSNVQSVIGRMQSRRLSGGENIPSERSAIHLSNNDRVMNTGICDTKLLGKSKLQGNKATENNRGDLRPENKQALNKQNPSVLSTPSQSGEGPSINVNVIPPKPRIEDACIDESKKSVRELVSNFSRSKPQQSSYEGSNTSSVIAPVSGRPVKPPRPPPPKINR